jgi:hypothetical protein
VPAIDDYFKWASAGDQLVVEAPIRSRSNLGWVIPIAGRISDRGGINPGRFGRRNLRGQYSKFDQSGRAAGRIPSTSCILKWDHAELAARGQFRRQPSRRERSRPAAISQPIGQFPGQHPRFVTTELTERKRTGLPLASTPFRNARRADTQSLADRADRLPASNRASARSRRSSE